MPFESIDLTSAESCAQKVARDVDHSQMHKPIIRHPALMVLFCVLCGSASLSVLTLDVLIITRYEKDEGYAGLGCFAGLLGLILTLVTCLFLCYQSNLIAIVTLVLDIVAFCANISCATLTVLSLRGYTRLGVSPTLLQTLCQFQLTYNTMQFQAIDLASIESRRKENEHHHSDHNNTHKPIVRQPGLMILFCVLCGCAALSTLTLDILILTRFKGQSLHSGIGIWTGLLGLLVIAVTCLFLRLQTNLMAIVTLVLDTLSFCVNLSFSVHITLSLHDPTR
ncbi:hypothetical protein X801_01764, partial [Opisthorchis viverrini]